MMDGNLTNFIIFLEARTLHRTLYSSHPQSSFTIGTSQTKHGLALNPNNSIGDSSPSPHPFDQSLFGTVGVTDGHNGVLGDGGRGDTEGEGAGNGHPGHGGGDGGDAGWRKRLVEGHAKRKCLW